MKKFSAAALAVIALAATAIPALAGGWQGNYDRQVAKVRAGFELGYVSAEPEGDDLCVPPRDMIKAGYAPPIDVLATSDEPRGEFADTKQWFCSYKRSDGVIVNFGSSFTPREAWRNSR